MSSLVGTSLLSDDEGVGGYGGYGAGGVFGGAAAAPPRRGPRIMRSESPSSGSAISRPRSYVVAKSRAGSLLNNARPAGQRSATSKMPKDAVDRAPQQQHMQQQHHASSNNGEDAMRRRNENMRKTRITTMESAAKKLLASDPG